MMPREGLWRLAGRPRDGMDGRFHVVTIGTRSWGIAGDFAIRVISQKIYGESP